MNNEELKYTPMMMQYLEIKKDYKDAIVFFRLGDFYEMFFEDAAIASRVLEITLTGKDAGVKERIPMCGIPFHAYQTYAMKLLEKGYKVAICEQVENPKDVKGIVKREVIKVLTPGTIIDDLLDSKQSNYLAAINYENNNFLIAYADISTGDCYVTLLKNSNDMLLFLKNINVKEVVVNTKFPNIYLDKIKDQGILYTIIENQELDAYYKRLVADINVIYYSVVSLLLNYAKDSLKKDLKYLKNFIYFDDNDYLKLDYFTKRNLELTETLRLGQKTGTILNFIDHTETAMGARMLRRWIDRPLKNINEINKRLDYVEVLVNDSFNRDEIIKSLRGVYDLERIVTKVSCENTNAKDLVQLAKTLTNIPNIINKLNNLNSPIFDEFINNLDPHYDLCNMLSRALVDNPSLSIREGDIIKDGFNEELDKLRALRSNTHSVLLEYEAKEKERLGVKNLKVGYNRVFGYYIEISKGQALNLNDIVGYTRKQTLANCERYISSELKQLEDAILGAKDKIESLEYEIFIKLREYTKGFVVSLQILADYIAKLDCYLSLAFISSKFDYVRPYFNGAYTEVIEARHIVLEDLLKEKYVPNDIYLNNDILIITGPNMSGKSTYMRVAAIIIILAQMGCFVPAKSANINICDQIFTRIGASDDLYSGQSTFMVEMSEANYALRNATKDSLILFDEIGRGTATFDGMALAQAIIEYINQKIGCRTLFSTHYHELTQLEDTLKNVRNVHVAAVESKGNLEFLHKVSVGPSDKSYGINVAQIAGLPKSLIERSKKILEALENKKDHMNLLNLDDYTFEDIKEEVKENEAVTLLKSIDVDDYSPKDALQLLYKLKDMVNNGEN